MNASTYLHGVDDPFELARLAEAAGLGEPAIVVERLSGGEPVTAALDPGAPISPASMIKVPLAAALCALWERGVLSADATVTVSAAHVTANDDVSPFVAGYATDSGERRSGDGQPLRQRRDQPADRRRRPRTSRPSTRAASACGRPRSAANYRGPCRSSTIPPRAAATPIPPPMLPGSSA